MTNTAKASGCFVAIAVFIALLVFIGAFFTVHETEQVVITQFGNPVGDPINASGKGESQSGLHFKIPFIWQVNRFEKRILEWDGRAEEMPTKDKTYISVDTFARWRISDPLQFFRRLRDERSALSRLDDILGSETRNTIAKHELIEVVRTTKDRQPLKAEELVEADLTGTVGKLLPIRQGQAALEKEIFDQSKAKLTEFGIELLDVRFKRVNYNDSVQERIYERMISERQQIAERFRSEGAGEAAKILGSMEKELREIQSTAYKEVETIKGEADAKATEIYAKAYNQGDEAADFYEFSRTMELYLEMLKGDSTLILSTDSDLFKYLKRIDPKPGAPTVPAVP
ncbi:MAG: protease modulator HflC [Verrucomicrobiae bacterium]|nr:protease modulator HflC [Verrucomicrobiae bacterium]